jgi:hypothetical protein
MGLDSSEGQLYYLSDDVDLSEQEIVEKIWPILHRFVLGNSGAGETKSLRFYWFSCLFSVVYQWILILLQWFWTKSSYFSGSVNNSETITTISGWLEAGIRSLEEMEISLMETAPAEIIPFLIIIPAIALVAFFAKIGAVAKSRIITSVDKRPERLPLGRLGLAE